VYELYAIDLRTGDARALTRGELPAIQPAWSPDGSLLAYTANTGKGFRLYLVTADGKGASPIDLSSPTDEYFPDWKD
jgi:Tol biopolymer transport system component